MEKTEKYFEGIGTVICKEVPPSEMSDYEVNVYCSGGDREVNTILAGFDRFYIGQDAVGDDETSFFEVGRMENFKFDIPTETVTSSIDGSVGDMKFHIEKNIPYKN